MHGTPQLRVDVSETDSLPEVRPYFPGTPLSPPAAATLPYPITLIPRHKNDYFVAQESFNVLGMFQNPMMMLMVGAGVMVLVMPYIMVRFVLHVSKAAGVEVMLLQKNMDPETLQELNERHARISNIQNSIQNGDFAS